MMWYFPWIVHFVFFLVPFIAGVYAPSKIRVIVCSKKEEAAIAAKKQLELDHPPVKELQKRDTWIYEVYLDYLTRVLPSINDESVLDNAWKTFECELKKASSGTQPSTLIDLENSKSKAIKSAAFVECNCDKCVNHALIDNWYQVELKQDAGVGHLTESIEWSEDYGNRRTIEITQYPDGTYRKTFKPWVSSMYNKTEVDNWDRVERMRLEGKLR
jgi:hypothetical protein